MKIIKAASIGLAIGFVFTTFYMTLFVGFNELTTQLVAWLIASTLYGLSALIFEHKTMNILQLSIIHYILCLAITAVMLYMFYQDALVPMLICFTVTYVIIYIIMFVMQKEEVKRINAKLEGR